MHQPLTCANEESVGSGHGEVVHRLCGGGFDDLLHRPCAAISFADLLANLQIACVYPASVRRVERMPGGGVDGL